MNNYTEDKQSLWRVASPSLPLYIDREEMDNVQGV